MTRKVEIGRLREPLEIIDEPLPAPVNRIGRIRHANGENVAIDHETLRALMERAREARERASDPETTGGILMA